MPLGKFERNAAVHLAQEIKNGEAWRAAFSNVPKHAVRPNFEIMKEALARLDIDNDDFMVLLYLGHWERDAATVNEFVNHIRATKD